jgi:O-antigen ligase
LEDTSLHAELPVNRSNSPAVAGAALMVAVALPMVVTFNVAPSPTLFGQLLSLAGWGVLLALLAPSLPPAGAALRRLAPLLLALGLLSVVAVAAALGSPAPAGLSWGAAGMLSAAAAVVLAGASVGGRLTIFHAAWVVAGALNGLIAIVQVFAPSWPDGVLIAAALGDGRAVGNVRQSNHLSSLLLWSAVALVPLVDAGHLRLRSAGLMLVLMMVGAVLSGSRTGMLGVVLLGVWGLADRRLSLPARSLLWAAPLVFAGAWWLVVGAAGIGAPESAAAQRLAGGVDGGANRLLLWCNVLKLIAAQPWTGVGFGQFNFAWTLTPLTDRPAEYFSHAHNLPLHLAAELGVPLALVVLGLLALALWLAARRAWRASGPGAAGARAAFVMLLLVALHSQLEYPLWHASFLLPTAWVLGACLGLDSTERVGSPAARDTLRPLGLAMVVASLVSLVDYSRVVPVFASDRAVPLAERIADGQGSWLHAHHADYAGAVTARASAEGVLAFERATHYVLDGQLLAAWARRLAQQGDLERARHVAQRLREFDTPEARAFFEPCAKRLPTGGILCDPPSKALDWRDF